MSEPVTLPGPASALPRAGSRRQPADPWVRQGELIVACVLTMALIAYWDGLTDIESLRWPSMAIFAVSVVFAVASYRRTRDLLNPLTVLCILFAVRIGLPSVLLMYSEIPPDLFYDRFHLTEQRLVRGQVHAGLAVLAVILGWYACPPQAGAQMARLFEKVKRFPPQDPTLLPSALLAFAVGFVAAIAYLSVNFGDPLAAATSGITRSGTVEGTSRYSFTAVALLVTSSVLLTLYLSQQDRKPLVVYSPTILACAMLTVFGGRVGALGPLGLGYMGVHYLQRARGRRERSLPRRIAVGAVFAVLLVGYAGFVVEYRGGEGVGAANEAFSAQGIQGYAEESVWTELGTLHSFPLGERLGAGVVENRTYPEMMGPLVDFLPLDTERPGRTMVERFGPTRGYGTAWGFHTGLYVDVFTNTGLWAAVLACVLFGAALRAEYTGFTMARKTLGTAFLHCLFLWTMIWVFFESVVVILSQFQVAIPVVAMIYLGSRLITRRTSHA